jgi:hypothetical protein
MTFVNNLVLGRDITTTKRDECEEELKCDTSL